jgi:hypothetical protein
MSKVTKNVVMVFTLVCVVVLVIFCVELFLLNRDNGDRRPDATISNNETEAPSPDGDLQIADDPSQDLVPDEIEPETDPPEDTEEPDSAVTPPENARPHVFLLSADVAELVFYIDTTVFETENLGESWLFSYLHGEDAWLEIGFVFVHPEDGARELAQNFLHNYLEGDYSTFEGERTIGNSSVRGVFVTGENEGETFEAWLRDLADLGAGSLALVVVVRHSTEEERDALYRVLDTMSIRMLNAEGDGEENGEAT